MKTEVCAGKYFVSKWVTKKVIYEGKEYTVVDVDYNGGLLIDKRNRYNDTTSVPEESVTEVKP